MRFCWRDCITPASYLRLHSRAPDAQSAILHRIVAQFRAVLDCRSHSRDEEVAPVSLEQPFARYRLPWTVPTLHLTIVCAPLPLEPTTPSSWICRSFGLPTQRHWSLWNQTHKVPTPSCSAASRQHRYSSATSSQFQPAGSPFQVLAPLLYALPNPDFGCFAVCTKPKTLPAVRPCGRFRLRFGL